MKKAYLILFIFAFAIYSCSGSEVSESDEKESEQVVEEENLEEPVDTDLDGIADEEDNCPEIENPEQINSDEDEFGNACDEDDDNDGLSDNEETTCGSDLLNAESTCEICDDIDNDLDGEIDEKLTTTYFMDQDEDGYGDPAQPIQACTQPEGYASNNLDQFPEDPLLSGIDSDIDGVDEVVDNCPTIFNPGQEDEDENGIGDACTFDETIDLAITGQTIKVAVDSVVDNEKRVLILIPGGEYKIARKIEIRNKNITLMAKQGQKVILENDGVTSSMISIVLSGEAIDNEVNILGEIEIDCNNNSRGIWININNENTVKIIGITIRKGKADNGGGIEATLNSTSTLAITNSSFLYNNCERMGAGVYVNPKSNSSVLIEGSQFIGNVSDYNGGGIDGLAGSSEQHGTLNIINSIFFNNHAAFVGGGIDTELRGKIINNSFDSNKALDDSGGAISASSSYWRIFTTEISNNIISGSLDGGGISYSQAYGNTVTINNNAFDNNSGDCGGSDCHIYSSWWCWGYCNTIGTGNILCNPEYEEGEDLYPTSNCIIDAGNNDILEFTNIDKDGNPRNLGNAIDLGAYEVQ